jgi:hypothetical protein
LHPGAAHHHAWLPPPYTSAWPSPTRPPHASAAYDSEMQNSSAPAPASSLFKSQRKHRKQ